MTAPCEKPPSTIRSAGNGSASNHSASAPSTPRRTSPDRDSRRAAPCTSARRRAAATAARAACSPAAAVLGIERVEQREEIVLVRAAAVEEDERALRLARRRALERAEAHARVQFSRGFGSGVSIGSTCARRCSKSGGRISFSPRCSVILVGREARARASRSRRARRSARGSRSSGTRSGRSPASGWPPASATRRCQASCSSIVDAHATWCTVPAPGMPVLLGCGLVLDPAAAQLAARVPALALALEAELRRGTGRCAARDCARRRARPRSPAARARAESPDGRRSAARPGRARSPADAGALPGREDGRCRPRARRRAARPRSRAPLPSRRARRPCGPSRRPARPGAAPGYSKNVMSAPGVPCSSA